MQQVKYFGTPLRWMVVAFVLYSITYFLIVRADTPFIITGSGPWKTQTTYLLGGETSKILFRPIHTFDRKFLRPELWDAITSSELDNCTF